MVALTTTLPDLEEAVVAAVTALSPLPYRHEGEDAVWHESLIPLSPIYDPESLAHLAFSVSTQSSQSAGQDIQHRHKPGGLLLVESRVEVVFTYRIRADGAQVLDYRMSQRAARDVVAAVNALGNSPTVHCAVRPEERFSPLWDMSGQWLMVRTTFTITHEEAV